MILFLQHTGKIFVLLLKFFILIFTIISSYILYLRCRMYDGWGTVEELFQAITGAPPSNSPSTYITSGICKFLLLLFIFQYIFYYF